MNNFSKISDFSFANTKVPKYSRKREASSSINRRNLSRDLENRTLKVKSPVMKVFSILQGILIKKIKQTFNQLFTRQKWPQQILKIKFLPIQSRTEYESYESTLLELVKNQKFQTYISFKTFKSQLSSQKAHSFENILSKLCNLRKKCAFLMLTNYNSKSNNVTNRQMISQQLKAETQASQKFLKNPYYFRKQGYQKSVQISYLKIKIVKHKETDREKKSQARKAPQKTKYISLKDLQNLTDKKQYTFNPLDNKLVKRHYPKILE